MSLELPADIEPHLGRFVDHEWSDPAVYCLTLTRPDDLEDAWDRVFDTRPPYFEDLQQCSTAVYIGATNDLLSRLEDHRDGEVRVTALTEICEIDELRNIWWFDSTDRAFEREHGIAITMQNEYPEYYVHSR